MLKVGQWWRGFGEEEGAWEENFEHSFLLFTLYYMNN